MSSSDSEHSSPKPSKRRRVVISDSDSSDGSIIKTHRRRRVYRVTSDGETSEEDSDVPKPANRRKNYRVVSEDDTSYDSSDTEADLVISDSDTSASNSDWRSLEDSAMEEESGGGGCRAKLAKGSKKSKSKVQAEAAASAAAGAGEEPIAVDSDSDSSDVHADKCPICLLSFKKQEIANPETCDHSFCLDCLLEWSKNINTCPVDRQTFAVILVRKKIGGKIVKQLPVTVRPPVEEQNQEDATYCEICQECDREERMLLCDGCDLGYHLECLTPPMTEVPMDEWFCPECSQNSQNDAEVVEIDLEELPDLMEEARRLGESYGRTRTGRERESSLGPRVIPRTRQTERVRANIRADRDRNRAVILSRDSRERDNGSEIMYVDPDQPSTSSSGMDSVVLRTAESQRSAELARRIRGAAGRSIASSSRAAKPKSKLKRKRKLKRRTRRAANGSSMNGNSHESTRVREVRITEINDDGEEEEFVTYVKVKSTNENNRNGRKYKKKRTKNTRKKKGRKRRARTVRSQAAKIATVKKRLALALGLEKPNRSAPLLIPTAKNRPTLTDKARLNNSRYQAGISQVSLFGNSHDLNYSPTGSDTESEGCLYGGGNGNGNGLLVSSRPRNATSSVRRHASLKSISNPLISREIETNSTSDTNAADFISSILDSQKFWHSKKNGEVTLKADGTFLIQKNNNNNDNDIDNINKHSINNNESPVKEKKNIIVTNNEEENNLIRNETRLDLNNINQNDVVQNPMYNSPRGGGNRGNFRGGNNYNCENNRHSYGGQYGGGRDSYGGGGGRHSYGGPGGPRDGYNSDRRDFGPPINYNQGFEARGPHPAFGVNQQFRNRNPQQNFRNERPPRFPPPLLNDRQQHPFQHQDNIGDRPPLFPHQNSFQRFRPTHIQPLITGPRPPIHSNLNQPFQDEVRDVFQPHEELREQLTFPQTGLNEPGNSRGQNIPDDEDCDLYSDIEPPVNKTNSGEDSVINEDTAEGEAVLLLPPPEPPSGLLDFEESKSDRDCNDSDQELVIDDTPKEDNNRDLKNDDKYDPFADDSDSNEGHGAAVASQSFITTEFEHGNQEHAGNNPGVRLTAYDDDDDEDSQADCPNFSIYSSQTMDVARNSEQELSQQIGPLEPPPLPPDIPDDDDIIVGDIQACDLADIPEPSDPYVESLQKERQTLSKIPPKKISNDSRGKITFKIGHKLRLSNKLSNLYDEIDETIENSIQQEKEVEDSKKKSNDDKKDTINEDKSDEDEEEDKLEELEKELKEKEQKLREMERMEEMEKINSEDITEDIEDVDLQKTEKTTKKTNHNGPKDKNKLVSTIDLTEKSSDTIISVKSSPKHMAENDGGVKIDTSKQSEEQVGGIKNTTTSGWKTVETGEIQVQNESQVLYDKIDEEFISRKKEEDDDEEIDELKAEKLTKLSSISDDKEDSTPREDENLEEAASAIEKLDFIPEVENFPLEKDPSEVLEFTGMTDSLNPQNWDSDGGYTPCKDELPVIKGSKDAGRGSISPFESGLEPITPTKDKANDDLDGCRTPAGYAGLGTEAISETDEPMSFEEEVTQMNLRKEKEIEDGEIMEDGRLSRKTSEKPSKEKEEDNKRKKKKDKKEKGKESDKNKENIASQNQVAWKKISKNTKERQYRDKDRRSKSKEKDKEKDKENQKETRDKEKERERDKDKDKSKKKGGKEIVSRKKEKRKELERYDVRKIVADKPSRPRKDEYGRDIRDESRSRSRSRSLSRRRSLSRDRRSRSYSRNRSRSRSRSRLRRSWSRDRGSYSKGGRSVSRRRSLSRSRRKVSRRRSASRKRSISRKRSLSKRRSRSPSRKRRSLSPRRRSRGRSLSKNRRSRSRSREKKKEKVKKQHKSRSRSRNRKRTRSKTPPKRVPSRSREKKHTKRKQHPSRSGERSRERSRSREQRERNKNWEPVNEKAAIERERHASSRDRRSWSAQWTPSWSRSRSRTLTPARHDEVASHGGWSPPPVLDNVAVPPKNLTVILTNKEAIKKKKKEKKKDPKKLKELEKRKKNKRNRTPPPSKEVFASGDNILVSVCFNKENETNPAELPDAPEAPPLVTPAAKRSRRRETAQTIEPALKRSKKEKLKEKRAPKSPKNKKEKKKKSKAAEIAATKKPVAVIDLDQSPFREQTPSPRDVIVLSDDDDHKETQELATPEQHVSPMASPQHEQFVSQGPKTPPEPQIKFSINKQQSNLRTSMINPLHEEEEEEIDERADEELEMRAQEELELRLKIGPNTPPEPPTSPPTSPDAYDPFDPTKSRSPTPAASQEATPADERDRNQCNSPRNHDHTDDNTSCAQNTESDKQSIGDQQSQGNDKQIDKPKIISMVTIKKASPKRESPTNITDGIQTEITQPSNDSPNKNQQGSQQGQQSQGGFSNINPVLATVTAAVQRSGTLFNTSTPNSGQRNLIQPNRISPINQTKQRSSDRPHLPNLFANPGKATPSRGQKSSASSTQNKNASTMGQNGSDGGIETTNDTLDMSSPYSPGSSLSDGIFDPPSPGAHSPQGLPSTQNTSKNTPSKTAGGKTGDKKDAFDVLFGTSPAVKNIGKNRARKIPDKDKRKKSTNPKVGVRMDENQLQILDDLPSSAVEMQVKDKFLKKLNRQERVVEEVKLVLKPHYTKKHVTKEEYKDIMRKAVPKICHNKTGEINPKKIGQLVEAYVKKCRVNKKKGGAGGGGLNTAKGPKATKNLWS